MKLTLLTPSIIIMITGILFACGYDKSGGKPPIKQSKMTDCNEKSEWNVEKATNQLIGKWAWEYVGCDQITGGESRYVQQNELSLEFKSDSTLVVSKFGHITQTSSWYLYDNGGLIISVEPSVDQCFGNILLCDNRLEFNTPFTCDNYFIKLK